MTQTDFLTSATLTRQAITTRLYKELPEEDQPAHRLRENGPIALQMPELLAIALGVKDYPTAMGLSNLLRDCGHIGKVTRHTLKDAGFTDAFADKFLAIAEITRRASTPHVIDRYRIDGPASVGDLLGFEMGALESEELRVILLNTRNEVMKVATVYRGSVNASQVRVAEIFRDAIRENAASIVVVHNHPSGDPTPSPNDTAVTRCIVSVGKQLDIQCLDHVVIGQGRFISLKECGLFPA